MHSMKVLESGDLTEEYAAPSVSIQNLRRN